MNTMKHVMFAFAFLFFLSPSLVVLAAEQETVLFGPVRYDVRQRYGKDNLYLDSFKAKAGLSLIEIQNGDRSYERSDVIELSVNGEKVLRQDRYDYRFLICILDLQNENNFELLLKDVKPAGLKRPALPDRFVTITVKPYAGKMPKGVFGANTLERMNEIAGLLQRISSRESALLAVSSLNLQNNLADRVEAMHTLSYKKDASAQPLIFSIFNDVYVSPETRGEAALGLGILQDKKSIPALMNGAVDSDERVRLGSAKALAMFPEEDTREPLMKVLQRLDGMRTRAVIRTIDSSGWKPVNALLSLAESGDIQTSHMAIRMLGITGDPRGRELLLKLLEEPGPRDVRNIITALGDAKESRAAEPLVRMAAHPVKRAGKEAELGEALAAIDDPRAAAVITDLIEKTVSIQALHRLKQAYHRVTGKEYAEKPHAR